MEYVGYTFHTVALKDLSGGEGVWRDLVVKTGIVYRFDPEYETHIEWVHHSRATRI